MEYPDTVGHFYGPGTTEMEMAILDMDTVLVEFLKKIETEYPRIAEKVC